jgi:hypothetical protein
VLCLKKLLTGNFRTTERKVEQLQTDFTNLRQLQKELEVAADELKTAYARRIARNL